MWNGTGFVQCIFCPRWGYNFSFHDGLEGPLCGECVRNFCDEQSCRAPYPSARDNAFTRLMSTAWHFMPENAPGALPENVLVKIAAYQHSHFELGTGRGRSLIPGWEVKYCTQCCTQISIPYIIIEFNDNVYFRQKPFCWECYQRITLALRDRSATIDWCPWCRYHRILIFIPNGATIGIGQRGNWWCEYCEWWYGRGRSLRSPP